jgi:hypothetical protein
MRRALIRRALIRRALIRRALIRRSLAAAMAVLWLSSSNTSRAEDASPREHWYGTETLLTDAGALALFLSGVAVNDRGTSRSIVVGSGVAYLLGGPVVHLLHGRELTSLASLGLRVGLPATGGLVGRGLAGLGPYDDGDEVVLGTVFGALGGLLGAVILDPALLAWQPAPRRAGGALTGSPFVWRPLLTLTDTRAELGVMGSF